MARAVSFLFLFSISIHLLAVFLMLLFIEKNFTEPRNRLEINVLR